MVAKSGVSIIDINGQQRLIDKNFKIFDHVSKSSGVQICYGEEGNKLEEEIQTERIEKFIEVTIQGKKGDWIEWYPLKNFEEMNPEFNYGVNNSN